jgi:hypothetical protein
MRKPMDFNQEYLEHTKSPISEPSFKTYNTMPLPVPSTSPHNSPIAQTSCHIIKPSLSSLPPIAVTSATSTETTGTLPSQSLPQLPLRLRAHKLRLERLSIAKWVRLLTQPRHTPRHALEAEKTRKLSLLQAKFHKIAPFFLHNIVFHLL